MLNFPFRLRPVLKVGKLSLTALLPAVLVSTVLVSAAHAQDATDLYLVEIDSASSENADAIRVGDPIRLTDRDGYDNQPAFSADGSRIFFTSMHATDDGEGVQTDIWQVELSGGRGTQPQPFRQTPESEYSPTPIPGQDALSVIRVEADGRQRLWRLPLDLGQSPNVILPDVAPVGYHAWSADGSELILFVLDEPHRLVHVAFEEGAPGEPRTVFEDIGRSLHRLQLSAESAGFLFIDKSRGDEDSASKPGWFAASVARSHDTDDIRRLVRLPEGREDVALAGQKLWVGDGSRLLRTDLSSGDLQEVVDLGRHGIAGITRLAFDDGAESDGTRRLAVVAQRAPEKVRQLEIVDRSIAHHGGALFAASETEMRQCSRSGCSKLLVRMDGGHYSYDVTAQYRGQERRVRVTNDTLELWRDGDSVPVEGSPSENQRLRDWAMARVYFPFLPFRLDDPSVWKQDLGLETWNGRQLHKVRVSFDAGTSTDADDVYMYWFDAETAELAQFAYSYSGNPGGLRFRVLEKPRRVGGLLFQDQKNYGTEGPGLTVERLTADSVQALRLVSTVTFEAIEVRPLTAP